MLDRSYQNAEIKNRERIVTFVRNISGRMSATTFRNTKEDRFQTNIQEIVTETQTYTYQDEILEKFREHLSTSI